MAAEHWGAVYGVPGTSVRLGISEEDLTSDNEWKTVLHSSELLPSIGGGGSFKRIKY